MVLTPKGELLEQYARNIVRLTAQAEQDIASNKDYLCGDVYSGTAETCALCPLFDAMRELQLAHPRLKLHVYSGNALVIHELIRYWEESPLCYRPLTPAVPIRLQLI